MAIGVSSYESRGFFYCLNGGVCMSGFDMQKLFSALEKAPEQIPTDELQSIYNAIIYDWETVSDIDFSRLNEKILFELLENASHYHSQSSHLDMLAKGMEQAFRSMPRIKRKTRLI